MHKTSGRQWQNIIDKHKRKTGTGFYEQMNILTIIMDGQTQTYKDGDSVQLNL